MPNLRSKTWTPTTPANTEDAQYWEDHLISDAQNDKISSSVQSVNGNTPDSSGNVDIVAIPDGGTTGQVLTKKSNSDADADWEDPKGEKGDAATITVGTVTTLPAGSSATVTNSGTTSAAVFDFGLPRGIDGTGAGDMVKLDYDSDGDVLTAGGIKPYVSATLSGKQDVLTAGTGIVIESTTDTIALDISYLTGSNISYDHSSSGASATNVQDALDELFSGGGGGGILPRLKITSESTATVTVTYGSSTIVPTSIGTGVWECEVPGYGVYTVHSDLFGVDATVTVNVTEVKIYEVNDSHYEYTINVTCPNDAAVTIASTGETVTGTGSGAYVVHKSSTSYTVKATLDGNDSASQTVVTSVSTGGSTSVTIVFGTITVSVDAAFITAGSTITCTKGGLSCTPKAAASTVTFYVPETGSWIVDGEISGTHYPQTANVEYLTTPVSVALQTIPDGSTITPVNDIQTWLNCAGIYNKTSYTTISDVLGDSTTLLALMSDNNAVDYLVRSTSWVSDICADSTAMTDIGANNYCADTLLGNSTWFAAIFASTYMSSVLNVYVPTLSADSNNVIESGHDSATNAGWHAFDGSSNTGWYSNNETSNQYIGYDFGKSVDVYGAQIDSGFDGTKRVDTFVIQGSDGGTWNDIHSDSFTNAIKNPQKYTFSKATFSSFRFFIYRANSGASMSIAAMDVQFYGREDV